MNEAAHETAADRYRRAWDYDDIAWFLHCKKRHAEEITKKPGFPPPVSIPGSSLLRWAAPKVIRWYDEEYLGLERTTGVPDIAVAPSGAAAPARTRRQSPRRGPDRAPAGRKLG